MGLDSAGNVYVADTSNDEIRLVSSTGLVAGDTAAFSETFDTKNAGTGKTLTVSGSVSDGNGGHNYTVTFVSNTAGVINKAGLTITAAANTKIYDGTTSATATPTVVGLQGSSDTVTGLSETYDNRNAGTGKTLTVAAGYVLNDGSSGNNYAVSLVTNTTGQITPLAITVTAAASTKTYDGTTSSSAAPTITSGALVTTLAGSATAGAGSSDGTGSTARFYYPYGAAVDSAGNVYVGDTTNDVIRKITPSGVVTTLAGCAGQAGSSDGTGSAARFNLPDGLAVDSAGDIYVADWHNGEIREISPSGVVTTLAGSAAAGAGSSDGTGSAARFNSPTGVAVDSAGNVYVADQGNDEIREISPSGVVSTLAGSARQTGFSDGTGSAARFDGPTGLALDSAGDIYVADYANDEIREVTPSGIVTTLAGSAAHLGSSDGSGSAARFYSPCGVAVDSAGNVYVGDKNNDEIREITPSGVVTTLAGSAGQRGSSDGSGSAARFDFPYGVAVDNAGNVYVADSYSMDIREISTAGLVSGDTAAFSETFDTKNVGSGKTLMVTGSVSDGNGGNNYAVTFVSNTTGVINQAGLTITAAANTKTYDGTTSAAVTPTVVGLQGSSDTVTGLSETYDTALPGTGKTLTVSSGYVVNDGNGGNNYAVTTVVNTTGVINTANTSTSLATSSGSVVYGTTVTFTAIVSSGMGSIAPTQGSVDFKDTTNNTDFGNGTFAHSSGSSSTWTFTTGVKTFNVTTGDNIQASYVPGTGFTGSSCTTTQAVTARPITVTAASDTKTYDGTASSTATPTFPAGGVVTTLAGSPAQTGSSDGSGSAARFDDPESVAVDSAGNVYVADYWNQEIRKITPSGVVTTLAGSAGQKGSSDGSGSAARFDYPTGVAVDSAGNVYVADSFNDEIRKITPSGVVTTLAGSAGQPGSGNGSGTAARFNDPLGVAVDDAGNVYVADNLNDEVRKITPSGVVATLAGSALQSGSSDGSGSAARFNWPVAVAVDGAGNVYVADEFNHEIRKITPSGVVATLAGSAGQTGSSNGSGSAARFYYPTGVAVDGAGNVYVADQDNEEIREITPTGLVATMAGSAGQVGSANGSGSAARFVNPSGVAVDSVGNVYVADFLNQEIRAISGASLVSGDTAAFSETFDTRNACTGKTLTVSGSVNDGNGGANYAVTFVSNTTGVINQAGLTITALPNTKTYDGTTSAATTPTVSGLQGSDTVAGLSETYDTKNVGSGKTLTVAAGYTVSDGNSGANYTVTTASSTAGVINQAPLTITAATNTKTYDGTTSAAATPTVTGLVGSDTVTGLSETYDTKNACTGKTLTVAAGYVVSDGNGGANYAVTTASSTAGVINKATLTITAMPNTKTYDATTSAAATPTVVGLLGSDTVTGLSETYDTKNACTGKTLTVAAGYMVSDGNGGGNYRVTTATSTAGVINKAPLTVTAAGVSKIYDGSRTAAVVLSDNRIAGDNLTDGYSSASFSNPGPGLNIPVTVAGIAVSGPDAGNYALQNTTANTIANVYQAVAVIDDSAGATGGWTTTGAWSNYPNQGYDGDIHQAVLAATAASTATWTFGDLDPNEYYKVETTWTTNGPAATSNRAANAPYTISGGAVILPVYVNQKLRRPE